MKFEPPLARAVRRRAPAMGRSSPRGGGRTVTDAARRDASRSPIHWGGGGEWTLQPLAGPVAGGSAPLDLSGLPDAVGNLFEGFAERVSARLETLCEAAIAMTEGLAALEESRASAAVGSASVRLSG